MRDEQRACVCGKEHPWGVIGKSRGVPLYGPRPIEGCDNYRAPVDLMPAKLDTRELWAQTGDLNPQAEVATRVVVAAIRSLAQGKNSYAAMAAQWPEFMGFVISQITDMRGALVRDETKFAHLVAHTDDLVETMRNMGKLSERLNALDGRMGEILERLDYMDEQEDAKCSAEAEALYHFGLLPVVDDEVIGRVTRPSKFIWSKPLPLDLDDFDLDDEDDDDEEEPPPAAAH